jgi:UDP-N-acetylglucosamine 3-dehydrogenase
MGHPDMKIGLVGYGSMGRNHARVTKSIDGVELIGVADSNTQLGTSVDGTKRVDSIEMLIELGIEACIVAAPTSLHRKIAEPLAQAGIATLIEKPLASNPTDALALVNAFKGTNTIGAVGHIERYNPAVQELKKRLDSGQLGDVFQIVTQRQGPFPARIGDVGVISDLASHDIDLTGFVSSSRHAFVMAATAHKSGREHEDLVSITGKLESGVVVNHIVNWLSPLKERQTIVTGERGALVASTLTGDLTFYENAETENDWEALANFRGVAEGNVTRYAITKNEPLRNELTSFFEAVRTGQTDKIVTLNEGLAVVNTCDAITRSALNSEMTKVIY